MTRSAKWFIWNTAVMLAGIWVLNPSHDLLGGVLVGTFMSVAYLSAWIETNWR